MDNENMISESENFARRLPRPKPINKVSDKPQLIRINEEALYDSIENIIGKNAHLLRGEYSFYCVYQKPLGSIERYALIHAFYIESDNVKYEAMDRIILEDGKVMHQSLIEANLACDYFFVLPYFDYADKAKGSVLLNDRILLTNELAEFEAQLLKDGL